MNEDDLQKMIGDYFEPEGSESSMNNAPIDPESDKRRHLRRDSAWEGEIYLLDDDAGSDENLDLNPVLVSNVSQGGAMVEMNTPLHMGTLVELCFQVTAGDDKPHNLRVKALVCYALPKLESSVGETDKPYRMGLSFQEVSASDAQYLECFANYIF